MTRRFKVYARALDGHHHRIVEEVSFEAAAVATLEGLDVTEHDISVIVHDVDTGHEHCFRLNLESGETSACG